MITLIENLFEQLLILLAGTFSESEVGEVKDFMNAGEYGLALDTAVDIFVEEEKKSEPAIISLIHELAAAMDLDSSNYTDRLQ